MPKTVPKPPKRLVPPMTTPAMTSRLVRLWPAMVVERKKARFSSPAMPARKPAKPYTLISCASTLMPTLRQASGLEPIASV